MALIKADRVKETSTNPGTGAFTLNGAVAGYRAFSAVMATDDVCYYTAINTATNQWECGWATFTSPSTLTRVGYSSASGAIPTNFSGTVEVFISHTAAQADSGELAYNFWSARNFYLGKSNNIATNRRLSATNTFLDNVIIGTNAMQYMGESSLVFRNVAIGLNALRYVASDPTNLNSSVLNIAIGNSAGANLVSGSGNTLIGNISGYNLNNGSNNVVISTGSYATRLGSSSSNVVSISSGIDVPSNNTIAIGNSGHTDCYIAGHLHPSGAVHPASIEDASAPTNAIYFSSTAGKLVYKDASGTVNNLY